MNATDVLVLMERIAITQLMRSRTSSDVLQEHQQLKRAMLRPTCHQWVATVVTRRRTEMDRHQMVVATHRRRMAET
jgi:predicted ATPase